MPVRANSELLKIMKLTFEEFKCIPLDTFKSIFKVVVNFLAMESEWEKAMYLISIGFPYDTNSTSDPRNARLGFYNPRPVPIPTPLELSISQRKGAEFKFLFDIFNKDSSSLNTLQQKYYTKSFENNFATGCFFLYSKKTRDDVHKVITIRDIFKKNGKDLDDYFINRYLTPEYLKRLIEDSIDFVQKERVRNMVITPFHYSGSENEMEKYFDKSVIEFIKSHRVLRLRPTRRIFHILVIPEIVDNIKSYLI